jgi:hypothetical protein
MTEPGDDQPPTMDEILATLQSPARARELEGEEALVDAMAAAIIVDHPEELAHMTSRTRPVKLGLLAGAAVLSLAGVAAAATGVLPDGKPARPPISTSTTIAEAALTATTEPTGTMTIPETTTTSAPAATITVPDTTTVAGGAALSVPPVSAPPCPADVRNHGDYVSRVAHETPPGPDHGRIVAAAAQSDCGQLAGAAAEPTTVTSAGPGKSDAAPGRSKGNSGSHGNGHGHG